VMMLAAAHGASVTIRARGEDEQEAVAALEDLFKRKFEEE
jgi:phosphocarrier protein HPr